MTESGFDAGDRIAIVGVGCRLPGGANSPDGFWRVLVDGVDTTTDVPASRFDVEDLYAPEPKQRGKIVSRRGAFVDGHLGDFDAAYFNLSPRESKAMDPQQRMLLEVTVEALADAGIAERTLAGSATAVYVGTFNNDYEMRTYYQGDNIDLYSVLGGGRYTLANRLSYTFDLRGPSMHIDSACSSTAVAFHQACEYLAQRRGPAALVGGCNLLVNPFLNIGLSYSGVLSPSGACRFGDAAADGYIRGEAIGMIVLKRLDDALRDGSRIYAVVRGSGVNHDGSSNGLLIQPSDETQVALMHDVWREAGIGPADIDYIEAHGTGTRIGDPIELRGFGRALEGRSAERPAYLGSVKTNVGHSEGGSGIASILKIALALRNRVIPPSLHFKTPHPAVDWDALPVTINGEAVEWPETGKPGIAVMNSFGMTGTNCHLVFEEFVDPRERPAAAAGRGFLLPISAKSEAALVAQLAGYRAHVAREDVSLADACYTAGTRGAHHAWRVAPFGRNREELLASIGQLSRAPRRARAEQPPRVAFVFSGQGSAWPRMGADLLEREPLFAEAIAEIDRALPTGLGWTVRDQLARDAATHALADTQVGQFCIFAVQVGLCRLLARAGVRPQAVVGHSLGEVTAAYVSGAIDLDLALHIIHVRSGLMRRDAARGRMVSVTLDAEACAARVAVSGFASLGVAVINGPRSTVVSGSTPDVEAWVALCAAEGIETHMLDVEFAFHSTLIAPFRAELESGIDRSGVASNVPLYSTVTGDRLDGAQLDPAHWASNMGDPVRFAPAVASVLRDGYDVLLEVSPHAVLAAAMKDVVGTLDATVLTTMHRSKDAAPTIGRALGQLYALGQDLDWSALAPEGNVASLPTYAFQRQRFWLDESPPSPAADPTLSAELAALAASLEGIRNRLAPAATPPAAGPEWFYAVQWRARAAVAPVDAGTWLVFADEPEPARRAACIWVAPGDAFAELAEDQFTVRPGHSKDYERLFERLGALGVAPTRVVDMWPARPGEGGAAWLEAHAAVGGHVLHAFQALLASGVDAPYWLVTRRALSVAAGEAPSLALSGLAGLARSWALECPRAWGGHLDLDAGDPWGALAAMPRHSDELCVAYRGGQAFVPRLARVGSPVGAKLKVVEDASYMITGGLGHIGLAFADHLVERGARELVLLGRSGPDHPAAAAVRARFEALGVSVHILAVDVADGAMVADLAAYVREHCRPLRGIVHGAGTYGYHPIEALDAASLSAECAPKVAGAWHLHAATLGQALDFFVTLSSIAGLWGAGTQAPYAAANASLDGLTHYRRAQGLPSLGLNWGMWAGGGMATPEIAEKLKRTGVLPMAPAEALAAFDRAASAGLGQVAVTHMDWPCFSALYGSQRPCRFFDELVATATTPSQAPSAAPVASPAETAHRLLAGVLGLDPEAIAMDQSLIGLGLDSLMAVELAAGLARAGIDVSIAALLQAPSTRQWLASLGAAAPAPRPTLPAPTELRKVLSAEPGAPASARRAVVQRWRYIHEDRPEATRRLVCFAYAGGGPFVFDKWAATLPADIELSTIILPGRVQRLGEAPFRSMEALVDALAPELVPLFDREVAFFGHCLGALVMFEVTHRLAELGCKAPVHLFASGARAPRFYTPEQLEIDVMQFSPVAGVPGHELGEADFLTFLKDLNFGTSSALYDDAEMRKIMLPTVQADLEVNNRYFYRPRPQLAMPITAIGGRIDPYVTGNHLMGWRDVTDGPFEVFVRGGDHYFIEPERAFLIDLVSRRLAATTANATKG